MTESDKQNYGPLSAENKLIDPVEQARIIKLIRSPRYLSKTEILQNIKNIFSDKNNNQIYNSQMQDDFRAYCLDYNLPLETNEMSRSLFLKERLNDTERKNLLKIVEIINKSSNQDKLYFGFGLFAIGSATYSDKYYSDLEKMFRERGLSDDDFIYETAEIYGVQFTQFENYDAFKRMVLEENKSRPFDDKLKLFAEEEFYKVRSQEQTEYVVKKRVGDILKNKGEDVDLTILPDGLFENGFYKYTAEKYTKFKRYFFENLSADNNLKVIEETSYLGSHDYADFRQVGGNFERVKEILDVEKTIRVSFPEGRDFHFYFKNYFADSWRRNELIENNYFVQLIRRSNSEDLVSTINNGFKTDTYDNPFVLAYIKELNKK